MKTVQEITSLTYLEKTNPKATFNAARSAFLADRSKKDLLRELRKEFGMEDKVSFVTLLPLLLLLPSASKRTMLSSSSI